MHMTNISKHKLPEKELVALHKQFEKTVAKLNQKTATPFIAELLGQEERIMFAKRLCAIVMYIEGNSSYQVWKSLHISPTTAEKIRLDYKSGRYRNVVRIIKAEGNDYNEFWETLEVILSAGLPPRGRGRWKSVFK